MDNETFDLIFSGELVAGQELAKVKSNLKALFRISDAQVEMLFSGKSVPLKKGLDADTVNKYRVAMKKAGAKVNVVQSRSAPAKPAAKPQAAGPTPADKPTAPAAAKPESPQPGYQTALGAQPLKPAEPRATINAPEYSVAATGSAMLNDNERKAVAPVQVDVSHISVADQGGNLVDSAELHHPPELEIDIPELDVSPAGSDVLKPEERPKQVEVEVDTSGLSLAETGERLGPKKAPEPAAPNVDHIKLAD